MRHLRACLCALTFAASSAGCASDNGSFVVDALWWINAVEAYSDNCREQGIDRVRLSVVPSGTSAPASTTEFDCELGHGQMRVARGDSAGLSVIPSDQRYDYTLEALSRGGSVLQAAQGRIDDAPSGSLIELPVIDIFEPIGEAASLSAEWYFPREEVESGCAARRITHVAIDIASASDPDFIDAVELTSAPCEDGVLVEPDPLLASGEYWVRYVALSDRGAVEQVGEALEASVTGPGQDLPLATWTFE